MSGLPTRSSVAHSPTGGFGGFTLAAGAGMNLEWFPGSAVGACSILQAERKNNTINSA
jgi:hypothetical protein